MTADAVGGVWQYALDLAEALRQHGVKTTLAVLGPNPSADQRMTADSAGVSLIPTGLPLDWTAAHPTEVEQAGEMIARLCSELRPDLVHLNSPALAASAAFDVPILAVCHSCVTTWWQAVKSGPLPEEFVWRSELIGKGYASADRLLAPSGAFARETTQAYSLAQEPIVVRNGRRAFPAVASSSPEPFVFTAGRLWDEGKNFGAIDRAASRISVPVLAAGPLEGQNGARVEAHHAKALGRLGDAEIMRYLAARPVFVSAARYEPFGLAALEAAQAGCALVLSDIPTLRELWDGAALFIDADDDVALSAEIEHLFRDPDTRAALGHAAQRRAQDYTVEAMSAGVLNVYRSMLLKRSHSLPLESAAV
ncbi:glycosyltransferase [Microvirga sp. SYSU G3D207]|uniref:Glycosyltransferase n=2 Tax=Microvirga arsenatis TaxID=2692265 RepID=A0ABW9Z2M2_9HYPH|nr:glycosyltransferase [Microvirga arsenatis]NBJ25251.1 glycosyltransferase [Microvirga arsenatis]